MMKLSSKIRTIKFLLLTIIIFSLSNQGKVSASFNRSFIKADLIKLQFISSRDLSDRITGTGLNKTSLHVNFDNNISYREIQRILKIYKNIPGGVVLEGNGEGLDIKKIKYDSKKNAFVINNFYYYKPRVMKKELIEIFYAVKCDTKIGVSIGNTTVIYGAINEKSDIALNLQLADKFLSSIVLAKLEWIGGYKFANGYIPKKPQSMGWSGGIAVYFNFNNYEFLNRGNIIVPTNSDINISIIPITQNKEKVGGYLIDENAFSEGNISKAYSKNIEHLAQNIDYYMKERILRIVNKYGETAAFARAIKAKGIDLTSLFNDK